MLSQKELDAAEESGALVAKFNQFDAILKEAAALRHKYGVSLIFLHRVCRAAPCVLPYTVCVALHYVWCNTFENFIIQGTFIVQNLPAKSAAKEPEEAVPEVVTTLTRTDSIMSR